MIIAAVVSLTLAHAEIQEARKALRLGSNRAAIDHCRVALDLGATSNEVQSIIEEAKRRMEWKGVTLVV